MHVGKMNAIQSQAVEQTLDVGPIWSEHSLLLSQPFGRGHLCGRVIQTCGREVEHEWRSDQREFQHPVFGVVIQWFWNGETLQLLQSMFRQPLIDRQLAFKEIGVPEHFQDAGSIRLPNETIESEPDQIQGLNAPRLAVRCSAFI